MSTHEESQPSNAAPGIGQARDLDRIVHEPARLVILMVLNVVAEGDFKFLEAHTQLPRGNLSAQTSKLEEAGYITIHKSFRGRYPKTKYRITPVGKAALAAYWERMELLQRSAQTLRESQQQGDSINLLGDQASPGTLPGLS